MTNLRWPVVFVLGVCMVIGQICFVAAQYTLAQWSYKSPFEQRKPKCAYTLAVASGTFCCTKEPVCNVAECCRTKTARDVCLSLYALLRHDVIVQERQRWPVVSAGCPHALHAT